MSKETEQRYEDIIHLPHHVSAVHPPMSRHDRAAQFSPFAALTGHGEAIRETERLTDAQRELEEDSRDELDWKLQILRAHLTEQPEICVSYFCPDAQKEGGVYLSVSGRAKRLDEYRRLLVFADRTTVSIEQIVGLDGTIFEKSEER